jgi:hypothetical protein
LGRGLDAVAGNVIGRRNTRVSVLKTKPGGAYPIQVKTHMPVQHEVSRYLPNHWAHAETMAREPCGEKQALRFPGEADDGHVILAIGVHSRPGPDHPKTH